MKTENQKNIFRIVVTDSGLGGLSVAADLENELRNKNHFGKIEIKFFNSLSASDFGYNSMPDSKKKAEVFDSALNTMANLYNPDMILIACNTLSVVYEDTNFSKKTSIDVIGIIDLGVEMILEELKKKINQTVLLLGTPTTIKSLSYQRRLVQKGISEEIIINQACPLLESEIQINPQSKNVVTMINEFIAEAKNYDSEKSQNIIAALCCTHYGYSENIFKTSLNKIFGKENKIVNPNKIMVEFVVSKLSTEKNGESAISVEVISQVKLREEEIDSISEILKDISPKTASALRNYTFRNNLFSFSRI